MSVIAMQKISVGEGISFCRLSTRSRYRNRLARFFSSEESTSKIESTAEIPSDNHQSQKIIFPWRHEDTLLPRLVEGTIDHATKGQLLTTVTTQTGHVQMNALASAFMFLDVPLYQFPFFGTWKGELADSVSWAFAQGVAGLLSNLIPQTDTVTSIMHNTDEVRFHTKVGGPTILHETTRDPEKLDQAIVPLSNMLEDKVIELYQSAQKNITKETEICLKTVPYSAELVTLYAIPYISRSNTKSDKALLEFYRTMMKKPNVDRTGDLNKLRRDKLESGTMESTVIAQVLVWCNEVFYVKDVESGQVLQGTDAHDSAKNVPHLVRMESTVKTTKTSDGKFRNIQEDWIITDIDDLLDGNLIV